MDKQEQKKLLTEIMEADAKDGLYHTGDTNKMVTAVEFLLTELDIAKLIAREKLIMAAEVVRQAKAMEKEQVKSAYLDGIMHPLDMEATKQAEQYYNETYGK